VGDWRIVYEIAEDSGTLLVITIQLLMWAMPKQSLGGKMPFPSRSLGTRRTGEILRR
jgi:hypothetical protein